MLFAGIYFLDTTKEVEQAIITTFLGQFRIQTMALGGFCAWLVYNEKTKVLNFIFRKDMQIIAYSLLAILFFSGLHFTGFLEVYAIFFGFFVLNVSCNPNSIISLENSVMSHLGKISYGLYIYHVFVIVLLINIVTKYIPGITGTSFQVLMYVLTLIFSVLVASLSYAYFEKPLLAFKDKRFGR